MTTERKLLITLGLCIAALILVPMTLFRLRYCRTVVIRDLSVAHTQTVSVAFHPSNMRWKISGHVQGKGTIYVPCVFSNTVTGSFSTNGAGDYYDTNVSVIFMPQGQALGKVRGSFLINDFF
jgi:hypothetical protein